MFYAPHGSGPAAHGGNSIQSFRLCRMKNKITIFLSAIIPLFAVSLFAFAGSLDPSSAPGKTMHTLEDIYCKYADCVPAYYSINSTTTPGSTMKTLSQINAVIDTDQYGRGWTPNLSGSGSTALSKSACEAASSSFWFWFEDGNGDGDIVDPEDGICVASSTVMAASWNGYDWGTRNDNSYIAAYTCAGNFPTGYVASYSGISSTGAADNTWNSGDCALCQADCYDGKKDLPGQNGYTRNKGGTAGYQGPLTPEVLKNWKGTRLPTFDDFYGYCGYKDGGSNYETNCTSTTAHGNYGNMIGRTDECLDLSNSRSYEWLSEQAINGIARVAGHFACSFSNISNVYSGFRFRAVFRP